MLPNSEEFETLWFLQAPLALVYGISLSMCLCMYERGTIMVRSSHPLVFAFVQIAIKVADISNPSRPLDLSKSWSCHIMEEFFRQGTMLAESCTLV